MRPARFTRLRAPTGRYPGLWSLRCACGSVWALGATLDDVRALLLTDHERLMPRCQHRAGLGVAA